MFDALGEGLDSEGPAQLHESVDGTDRFGRVPHCGNEGSVDLEGVDRHLAKAGERRVAGTHVVDRNEHTELLQLPKPTKHGFHVLLQALLGDVEDQRPGLEGGSREGTAYLIDKVSRLELTRRDVDRNR